jgi:hypothetical protein
MKLLRYEINPAELETQASREIIIPDTRKSMKIARETKTVWFLDAVYETEDGQEGSKGMFSGTKDECELWRRRYQRGQFC